MPLWLMLRPKRLINFMVVVGKSQDRQNWNIISASSLTSGSRRTSDCGRQVSSRQPPA